MEKYNGADPLAEWCAAEMKLNIDGKELIVKPTMEHYRKLRKLSKMNPDDAKEKVEDQKGIFKDILMTTFPNSSSVDDFLERYETKFQLALFAEIVGVPVEVLKKNFMSVMEKNANEK